MLYKFDGLTIKLAERDIFTGTPYPKAEMSALFDKLVQVVLDHKRARDIAAASASTFPRILSTDDLLRVVQYPEPEKKFQAIKVAREVTGMGLAEAKAWVEGTKTFRLRQHALDTLQDMGWRFGIGG